MNKYADSYGRWYDVIWSVSHHGQYVPDRPWCLILRSKPGTPGEPSNGIRYMKSYATREEAIRECAKERAFRSKTYQRIKVKLQAEFERQVGLAVLELERDAPTGPPA